MTRRAKRALSPQCLPYKHHRPVVHPTAFIAPGAWLIGRVSLGPGASIWFNTVLRGDVNRIAIGAGTNIQDGSIVHVDLHAPCIVRDHVHVGHHVNLHGCTVERQALIGMGAIILSGAHIGRGAVIGAGSVVLEGARIPPNTLAVGIPARVVRRATARDRRAIRQGVQLYRTLSRVYRSANSRPAPPARRRAGK